MLQANHHQLTSSMLLAVAMPYYIWLLSLFINQSSSITFSPCYYWLSYILIHMLPLLLPLPLSLAIVAIHCCYCHITYYTYICYIWLLLLYIIAIAMLLLPWLHIGCHQITPINIIITSSSIIININQSPATSYTHTHTISLQ